MSAIGDGTVLFLGESLAWNLAAGILFGVLAGGLKNVSCAVRQGLVAD